MKSVLCSKAGLKKEELIGGADKKLDDEVV